MKIIVSQNGNAFMGIGNEDVFANIEQIEAEADEKEIMFSVGVDGVSLGQYKTQEQAKRILLELMNFMAERKYEHYHCIDFNGHFEMPKEAN